MEKRIMAPSRATWVDVSKPMRNGQRVRLTKVTFNRDNPTTPAVGQFNGTVDTPSTRSFSSRKRKKRKENSPNEHGERAEAGTHNHLLGLRVQGGQSWAVQGIFASGEWLVQSEASQEFDGKEHVDHDSGELEDNTTYDVRERRFVERGNETLTKSDVASCRRAGWSVSGRSHPSTDRLDDESNDIL